MTIGAVLDCFQGGRGISVAESLFDTTNVENANPTKVQLLEMSLVCQVLVLDKLEKNHQNDYN